MLFCAAPCRALECHRAYGLLKCAYSLRAWSSFPKTNAYSSTTYRFDLDIAYMHAYVSIHCAGCVGTFEGLPARLEAELQSLLAREGNRSGEKVRVSAKRTSFQLIRNFDCVSFCARTIRAAIPSSFPYTLVQRFIHLFMQVVRIHVCMDDAT